MHYMYVVIVLLYDHCTVWWSWLEVLSVPIGMACVLRDNTDPYILLHLWCAYKGLFIIGAHCCSFTIQSIYFVMLLIYDVLTWCIVVPLAGHNSVQSEFCLSNCQRPEASQ